jgi:hypothetical protein
MTNMIFPDKKQQVSVGLLTGVFPVALFLAGCAETASPAYKGDLPDYGRDSGQHVISGSPTTQDHAAIETSNQRIFDAEHADSSAVSATPDSTNAPTAAQGGSSQ